MSLVASVRAYVDTLVHPSARRDALAVVRHRAFIALRLLGGLVALAVLPVYLAVKGAPSALEVIVFGWLVTPVAIAWFLSRTGRYEAAHLLSALALTALVTMLAMATGGIASFAAVWLVVVPLDAALSASRRVVVTASLLALAAAGTLVAADLVGASVPFQPAQDAPTALAALGVVSAGLYATGLALGMQSLARTGSRLPSDEEEQRYRLLARNMTDIITRHGRNGAVLFASPATEQVFGAPPHELLGLGLFDRVHVADRPAYLKALNDAAALGQAQSVEYRVRRDATGPGSEAPCFIWVEMRCRPLDRTEGDGESNHAGEVVAVMREVSARKAQEQALEEAHAEAEETYAARSRFLATMSHELRTPLNAIIGFSEMLTQEELMKLDAGRRHEYARLINDSGHHLLAVVNGILDVSKIGSGNFAITPEPFAPGPVIEHCCSLLALKAQEAGIEVVVRAGDLPEINADKRALKQVLINLLSNAIKFTERGGHVTVTAAAESATLVLTVEDTGVGIGEEVLPYLGNPFFQARTAYNRRYEGTGLGLLVVKGLVGLHGGEIEIHSRVGTGTQVTVRIPRDCERVPRSDVLSKIASLPVFDETWNPDIKVKKRA